MADGYHGLHFVTMRGPLHIDGAKVIAYRCFENSTIIIGAKHRRDDVIFLRPDASIVMGVVSSVGDIYNVGLNKIKADPDPETDSNPSETSHKVASRTNSKADSITESEPEIEVVPEKAADLIRLKFHCDGIVVDKDRLLVVRSGRVAAHLGGFVADNAVYNYRHAINRAIWSDDFVQRIIRTLISEGIAFHFDVIEIRNQPMRYSADRIDHIVKQARDNISASAPSFSTFGVIKPTTPPAASRPSTKRSVSEQPKKWILPPIQAAVQQEHHPYAAARSTSQPRKYFQLPPIDSQIEVKPFAANAIFVKFRPANSRKSQTVDRRGTVKIIRNVATQTHRLIFYCGTDDVGFNIGLSKGNAPCIENPSNNSVSFKASDRRIFTIQFDGPTSLKVFVKTFNKIVA